METLSNPPVIADSSAIFALVSQSDSCHQQSVAIGKTLRNHHRPVILCAEVFSEALNIIGKKCGRAFQLAVAADLLTSGNFLHTASSPQLHEQALSLLKQQASSVSFTDCVVMAFADHYQTQDIFGFDACFGKSGYRLPTAS